MADKIIQTQVREARRPGAAFTLSLLVTGLGQMYNGDLLKGTAFLLMRTAALLAVPAAMVTREPASGIIPFICLVAASAAISIASPVEALVRARKNRELPVRAYNSPGAYAAYAAAQMVITCAAILAMVLFFAAGEVTDRGEEPLLEKGDIVLIYRYAPHGYRRGDLVFLNNGRAGRVIALPGDTVRYTGNIFYVNGMPLTLGYLPDKAIESFSSIRGDVLSETSDGRKYPVRFRQSAAITLTGLAQPVGRGMYLVSSDSRLKKDFARTVSGNDIYGRVDGILFSSYLKRIGKNAFGNLK